MKLTSIVAGFMALALGAPAFAQSKADTAALRAIPSQFSAAWAKHDGRELAKLMSPDVDFVNVSAIWLHGADFETYHSRILTGRMRNSTLVPIEVAVRFLRPDLATVRWSWKDQGDVDNAGAPMPPRYGLMTMVAEKRAGRWLVVAAQNTNAGPPRVEAADITSPIAVPHTP
nr:hypothetical protein [Phenylobacterium sp.]